MHIRISSYQCGGVLLNHLYVATAAHCVHQAKLSQITVHLGEYDTKDTEEVGEIREIASANSTFSDGLRRRIIFLAYIQGILTDVLSLTFKSVLYVPVISLYDIRIITQTEV